MKKLTLIDKAFLLKRTPLFSSLDLDLLLAIADKLVMTSFDPGDQIFVANEEANRMYFIVKGEVAIRSNQGVPICVLRSPEFFGDESLFNNQPRGYEAISFGETSLLTLTRSNLFTIISECPSVAVGFVQVYSSALPFRPRKTQEIDS